MSKIENSLSHLETHLRKLIEGEQDGAGIGRKFRTKLGKRLVSTMLAAVQRLPGGEDQPAGSLTAPDQYTLIVTPPQAQLLLTQPAELDRLTRKLVNTAARHGIMLTAPPILHVVADPHATEVKVLVNHYQSGAEKSCTVEVDGAPGGGSDDIAGNMPKAFLIVNGLATYPLTEPVINVGRESTNQVQLDDLRVSRLHAQLRLIQGRFVIFDLDSTGGTFVNGVAVSSHVLNAGDVIELGGVPVVYGQETSQQNGFTQKLPTEPSTPEIL